MVDGPYARDDYNLTICPVSTPESTPTHVLYTMANPMPELTFTLCQSRLYPHSWDKEFGLRNSCRRYVGLVEFLSTAKRIRFHEVSDYISCSLGVFAHCSSLGRHAHLKRADYGRKSGSSS
jgi:hypothetical protein